MSKFIDRFKTETSLEEEGVWVNFGDGIRVKIRRLNCKMSREVRNKLEKPYANQFRGKDYPLDIQEALMIKQLAKVIVVDWEGVPLNEEGDKMATNSEEDITEVMKNFPDFREDILTASMERSTFQKEAREEAEKNSSKSSAGASKSDQT